MSLLTNQMSSQIPILDTSSNDAAPQAISNSCLLQSVYQYSTKKVQLLELRLTGRDSR